MLWLILFSALNYVICLEEYFLRVLINTMIFALLDIDLLSSTTIFALRNILRKYCWYTKIFALLVILHCPFLKPSTTIFSLRIIIKRILMVLRTPITKCNAILCTLFILETFLRHCLNQEKTKLKMVNIFLPHIRLYSRLIISCVR